MLGSFRLRHFRRCPASPLPASASAAWGAVFSASHLLSFRSVLRAQSLCRPGVLLPFLLSGFSDPTGPAEGHVAPGKQPQSAQGAGARKLAAGRRPLLPALPGATESPLSEHDLRGHVVRAQRFRFSEQPGPGAEGAVLEVCVPQGVKILSVRIETSFLYTQICSVQKSCSQVLHLQYGMYVWPCAVVLAQYLWFHRRSLPGKAVLEIGAGTSLPGIIAAKCGAEVILSDSSELPHCLEICWQSCQMNNLPQVRVVGLTWGHISQDLLALPPQDIILASDVFFEPEDFEDILTTVYFLMQKNPKVQLWSTYQIRSADWSLEALLYKWDMKCVHIPLESFDADKEDIAESVLPGRHTVEMLVISFAKDSL